MSIETKEPARSLDWMLKDPTPDLSYRIAALKAALEAAPPVRTDEAYIVKIAVRFEQYLRSGV